MLVKCHLRKVSNYGYRTSFFVLFLTSFNDFSAFVYSDLFVTVLFLPIKTTIAHVSIRPSCGCMWSVECVCVGEKA